MREIKFRAWDKENKEMILPSNTFKIFSNGEVYVGDPQMNVTERYILMQYTGISDINNIEICEGDIFSDKYWWVGASQVKYKDGMFGFDYDKTFISLIDCDHIEVIGNIYENPDILKTEAE